MNKHPILKGSLIVIAAIASMSAIANENTYITFGAGHFDNDPFGDVYDDQGIRVRHSYEIEASLGYMLSNNFAVEGSVVMPSPTQASERADINQFRLSGLYFFGEKSLKPYLALGVGQEEFEKDGYPSLDSRGGFLSLGAGLQYDMNDKFFGRVEARIDDLQDNISYHAVYMLEVGYRFGIESSDQVVSYDAEKSTVAANDFTSEYYDGCCNETKAKDAASAETMQVDTQELAALPATAAGSNDDDQDGIINDLDQCALTAEGLTVDANGCAKFTGSISNVLFDVESSKLTVSMKKMLDDAASELAQYPNVAITVSAFTDNTGPETFNKNLSQERANNVRAYLMKKGVSADRIDAKGFGETSPVASNDTAEGRAQNRRAVFDIK